MAFTEYKDFALEVLLVCYFDVPDYGAELAAREALLLDIYRLAQRLGVEFAFPTQTLHVGSLPATSRP